MVDQTGGETKPESSLPTGFTQGQQQWHQGDPGQPSLIEIREGQGQERAACQCKCQPYAIKPEPIPHDEISVV
jgi:hypothetical protein